MASVIADLSEQLDFGQLTMATPLSDSIVPILIGNSYAIET
jgi:hypothetical protein